MSTDSNAMGGLANPPLRTFNEGFHFILLQSRMERIWRRDLLFIGF